MAVFAWLGGVYPAGLPLWSCTAIPNAANGYTGDNFAGWCFTPAEEALRTATSTLDARERAAAYLRHQQFWTRECPSVPLLQRPIAVVRQTDIGEVKPDALAPVTWNVVAWRR
jgi:peptide/nickel transport system substrate-binding protein